MVGVFDVLVPIHAARMARDELVAVVDAHAIGVGLERQALTRVARGHRVVVGVERDAELLGGAHRAHARQIEAGGVERQQLRAFVLEAIDRALVGLRAWMRTLATVSTQSLAAGCIAREVGQLEAGQEVLLDVADPILDPPLLLAGCARCKGEISKPQWREKSRYFGLNTGACADQALQHGGLQVVDHDPARGTPPKAANAFSWQARKNSIFCET